MKKFLVFNEEEDGTISVSNDKGDDLGFIAYHKPWNCMVWNIDGMLMAEGCLGEIVSKLRSSEHEKKFKKVFK